MEYCRKPYKTNGFAHGQKKLSRFQPRKSYGYQETFKNVGKIMVSCNLSVVRGRQSPECIEYTTFAFRTNRSKTLEMLAFLAAPACRATEMPAEAVVPRAKSYGFLKPFKNLGKINISRCSRKGERKEIA